MPRRRAGGDRPGEFEGHAGAAQATEGVAAAGEPRMHEHVGLGQRLGKVVMVGDDQFEAEVPGDFRLGDASDAAVDCHHEARALRGERRQSLGVEAVALLLPAWHIPNGLRVDRLQAADQDRRRAHAIGVVVAVDHDLSSSPRRGEDAVGRLGYARQRLGVAKIGERAREKRLHGGGIGNAAGREQSGKDARHAG